MKKPMIKALAATMALTMAFSSPLTASAGFSDLFKTVFSDGVNGSTTGDPTRPSDTIGDPTEPGETTGDPTKPGPSETTGDPTKPEPSETTGDPTKPEPSETTGDPTKPEPSETTGDPTDTTGDPTDTTGDPTDEDDIPAGVYEGNLTIQKLTLNETSIELDGYDIGFLEATVLMESDQKTRDGKSITVAVNAKNASKFENATVRAADGTQTDVMQILNSISWNQNPKGVVYLRQYYSNTKSAVNVVGLKAAETTVTATLKCTDKNYSASANVKVISYSERLDLTISEPIYKGHTYEMEKYLDRWGGNDKVTWELRGEKSNGKAANPKAYATITADGKLTAKKVTDDSKLKVYVVATSSHGKTTEAKLTIEAGIPATKVNITGKNVSSGKLAFDFGDDDFTGSVELTATTDPTNSTDNIEWTSSDKKGAIVSFEYTTNEAGKAVIEVTPKKAGKVTLTAKATSGKKATVKLTITAKKLREITGLQFNTGKGYAYAGQKVNVKAVTDPTQYAGKFTYVLNDKAENYADVKNKLSVNKSNGKISYKKNHGITGSLEVSIVVTPKDKQYANKATTETVIIKENPVTGVTINPASIINSMFVGNEHTYEVTVPGKPDDVDASDFVVWTVNNKKAASISETGVLKALASGKVTVTATVTKADGKTVKDTNKNIKFSTIASKIVINTPSVVKYESTKDQTVTLKSSVPKGFGDKETVRWSVQNYRLSPAYDEDGYLYYKQEKVENGGPISIKGSATAANVKLTIGKAAQVGDYAVVTVEAKNGARATAYVQICNKVTGISWLDSSGNVSQEAAEAGISLNGKKFVAKLKQGESIDLVSGLWYTYIKSSNNMFYTGIDIAQYDRTSGFKAPELLTYSSNKKGMVNIKDGVLWGLKKGTVKVTVKAPSGKKVDLNLTIE